MENDNIDTKNFFEKAKDLILAKKISNRFYFYYFNSNFFNNCLRFL